MEGDQANVKIALEHYNKMILNVAKTIGQIEDAQQATLGDLLDQTLSVHEEQLARITSNIGKGEQGVVETEPVEAPDDASGKADANYCDGVDRHPHAEALVEDYENVFADDEVGYSLIMGWFCNDNFGFGEIEHALRTSDREDVDESPQDLLDMRETMGWGEIWQLLELIEEEGEDIPVEDKVYCVGADPHPVAEDLSDDDYGDLEEFENLTPDEIYGQIMDWFCENHFGFGEIIHLLKTGKDPDVTLDELIEMRIEEGMSWGKIWQELGLIGKPEDPGNKPENPGNKPESPPGKPDDVGPNNDTNKPVKTDKPKDKKDKNDKPKD
jgi:hypothetical protein